MVNRRIVLSSAAWLTAAAPLSAVAQTEAGEVFDYYCGTRTAEEIVGMLRAIRSGTAYPISRCIKRGAALYSCDAKG